LKELSRFKYPKGTLAAPAPINGEEGLFLTIMDL